MNPVDRTLDRSIEAAQISISTVIAEKGELTTEVNGLLNLPSVTIKDRGYLEEKTKGMISRCERILDALESSFNNPPEIDDRGKEKGGFSLYAVDVYAKIVNAVAVQIRELRELNKMVMGIDVINAEQIIKKTDADKESKSKDVKMTSTDLLKLIKEASKKTELNAVDAIFDEVKPEPKEQINEPAGA
jgi:hypothetical protein